MGSRPTSGGATDIHVDVTKDKTVELKIESVRFDRDQYAGLEVEVDWKKGWDDEGGSDSEP